MEREVLFYSLTIYLIFRLGGLGGLKDGDGWKAAFPLTRSLWWYPTAYASFIVLEPMARRGLKAMGRREHGLLTATVTLMWGLFQGLIRTTSFTGDSVVVFIVIYAAICYIRWYHDNLPAQVAGAMVAFGFAALIAQGMRGGLLSPTDKGMSIWLSSSYKLPVILISIGLVSLFSRLNFRSGAINFVARSAFGAYLISEYPAMRTLLWKGVFVFGDWATGPWAIPMSIGCVLAAFGLCAAADLLRRGLFKLTIDRHPGAVFDCIWQLLESISDGFQDRKE